MFTVKFSIRCSEARACRLSRKGRTSFFLYSCLSLFNTIRHLCAPSQTSFFVCVPKLETSSPPSVVLYVTAASRTCVYVWPWLQGQKQFISCFIFSFLLYLSLSAFGLCTVPISVFLSPALSPLLAFFIYPLGPYLSFCLFVSFPSSYYFFREIRFLSRHPVLQCFLSCCSLLHYAYLRTCCSSSRLASSSHG